MVGILSTPKAPPPPPLPPPTPMPDAEANKALLKRKAAANATRTGRSSTILTDYGASMGGNAPAGASGGKFGG